MRKKVWNDIFTEIELNELEKINRVHKCSIFKLLRKEIVATQYVGFIKIKNKTIQVIPKIFKNNDNENLHFLLYMLQYTEKLKIKNFSLTSFNKIDGSFFEVFIWLYARNLLDILKPGIKKQYVVNEENSNFLKGKFLIGEHIKYNNFNNAKFFCSFDEFTEDNRLNQILKYVSNILIQVSKNSTNKKYLKQILFILDEVQLKKVTVDDIDKIHFSRLNEEYRPIINLCKLILSNTTISFGLSKIETFSFMFDMNKLFEEFIYKFIKKHKEEIGIKNISGQKLLGKLFGEFNMYYDIYIKDENNRDIIIDTKYKSPADMNKHYGLSQADFYQMFAYSQSQEKKIENIILLYPKSTIEESSFKHSDGINKINLFIKCIDIQTIWDEKNKRLNKDAFIDNIKECINID
ncbi:5-methylcytosine-specific restriction enzyme subunit McrC [Clostridium beijerinckii]|uniref:McrC family protein n=1 Tax=Clostridium beijerinckii TaxID=1520 RepID=UPI00156F3604|nr:McrC family protein [Clostridium beijerinckii]NRV01589.1 5-methylcytosine-specific restriction enzyme subunit McrC [Clostridium beijerinckii]